MKKYISLLVLVVMLGLGAAVNADDHVEDQDTDNTTMESSTGSVDSDSDSDGIDDGTNSFSRGQDYNSSRSNRPRTINDNDCDDSDESCTPEMYQLKGQDRAAKVKQAIEARKMIIKQKREDRLAQVKQRVQSISAQKRAQFNGASKILQNKVSAVDNVNWLKNTSSKIDRVMSDIQNISNEETKALVEAVLIDLQTKIDDRLQEIYESSSETTLEEVLEDVMWEDVMEDEDSNNDDEDDDEEYEDDEEDEDDEDEDEDDEDEDEDEDEDDK